MKRLGLALCAGLPLLLDAGSLAAADVYPSRPISLVVPYAAGGTSDLVARILAQQLTGSFGTVIVDNRTGGGGIVGWRSVATAPPDGYTLTTADLSFSIAASLIANLPYDAKRDFAHIIEAISVPHVLVVHPSVPAKTVAEFIALAKASPGKLFYGSGGVGTNTHLAFELLKNTTGIDVVHVPFRGAGAVLQDLLGGRVTTMISAAPTVLQYIKGGQLRALMVTSDARMPALPDVPSAKEAGLPGMDAQFWLNISAPAKTPPEILARIHKEIAAVLADPAIKKRLDELGLQAIGGAPAEATKLAEDEIERWSRVIKAADIKPQ